jgi:hypothetical protein
MTKLRTCVAIAALLIASPAVGKEAMVYGLAAMPCSEMADTIRGSGGWVGEKAYISGLVTGVNLYVKSGDLLGETSRSIDDIMLAVSAYCEGHKDKIGDSAIAHVLFGAGK